MFDTIIKRECGHSDCYINRVLCPECYNFIPQYPYSYSDSVRTKMAYDKGFAEGKYDGFKMLMDEQEKYAQKLKEAMKHLEELKK